MAKQIGLCLVIVLLSAMSGFAQSNRKSTGSISKRTINIKLHKEIVQQIIRDDDDVRFCIRRYGVESFNLDNTVVRAADLNDDNQIELIISASGPCFGVNGIEVWIYGKVGTVWKQLLSDGRGTVIIAKSFTNGFRDITLRSEKIYDMYDSDYKFDGSQYQICMTKIYGRDNARRKFTLVSTDRHKCN